MSLNKKQAKEITGGLSKPSKMPGPAFNLPASRCITGAKLVKIPGSVCHGCYALKGRYRFKNVQNALERRRQALSSPRWVEAMTVLVMGHEFFRWHDSGDIQSVNHLKKICDVASGTPRVSHWLPTREAKILKEFKEAGGVIPSNLVIRLSATMINGAPSKTHAHSSTVHTTGVAPIGEACNASHQGGRCLDCRACWNPSIKNISYEKH